MLDLGLTKMALIGVVALVVLGPERLPRVARTAGALFGRAQRYINDVKAEVAREIELDHLRQMKTDFESAARNVENSIHDNLRKHEAELNDAFRSGTSVSPSIAGGAAAEDVAAASDMGGYSSASPWRTTAPPTVKRVSWRTKRTAAPVWYKRAVGRRTHVQSGAARVARHTPASLRKQRRFL
jgi:sec-independent protein translocase protein TatB